jgi:hypothetical protein
MKKPMKRLLITRGFSSGVGLVFGLLEGFEDGFVVETEKTNLQ